jgi:hypothetical protein
MLAQVNGISVGQWLTWSCDAYLIKTEVHMGEEIYEQDYPGNLQAKEKPVNRVYKYTPEQKGH